MKTPLALPSMLLSVALVACQGGAGTRLAAVEHDAAPAPQSLPAGDADLLTGLPVLPKPQVRPAPALGPLETLAPGVAISRGRCVVLEGVLNVDQGPTDGLEVLASLKNGKNHESLIKLDTTLGQLVKAACIAALGLGDGQPTDEGSGLPARGTPVALSVRWQSEGATVTIAASSLVRDRVIDRPYPALAWTYTGSRFARVFQNGPDGQPVGQEVFMLDATRSIAVNFDEPDALIASPFPGAVVDVRFETNSGICPPAGTPVQLVIEKADLPIDFVLAGDGSLGDGTTTLDAAALSARLSSLAERELRVVTVQVDKAVARTHDAAARARIIAAAAAAKTWLVPVFVLKP
jgi:hypothetical protein